MNALLIFSFVISACFGLSRASVVGGTATTIADYPHQLSLRNGGSHSCGASLISSTKSVTAAHCVGSAVSSYTLLGGSTDRLVTNCPTCVLFSPVSITRHPDYLPSSLRGYPNDVAVIKHLHQTFNVHFKAIDMATDGSFAEQQCTITGWGRLCGGCALPTTLQVATMTVMHNNVCALEWGTNHINDGHVCIISEQSSACNGDSGGPLVCKGLLVGATSWGANNCPINSPNVYTRISYFYDWINQI